MAQGTMKQGFHISAGEANVSMPFTAPTDGVLYIRSRPQSSASSYSIYLINNSDIASIRFNTNAGADERGNLILRKGDVVTNTNSGNCTDSYIWRRFEP